MKLSADADTSSETRSSFTFAKINFRVILSFSLCVCTMQLRSVVFSRSCAHDAHTEPFPQNSCRNKTTTCFVRLTCPDTKDNVQLDLSFFHSGAESEEQPMHRTFQTLFPPTGQWTPSHKTDCGLLQAEWTRMETTFLWFRGRDTQHYLWPSHFPALQL